MMSTHKWTPDIDSVHAFFERMFSHVSINGQIEIAFNLTDDNKINQARMFKVEDYMDAADFVIDTNKHDGQNVYFGPALRRPDCGNNRASDTDCIALLALFADFDKEGAMEAAVEQMKDIGLRAPVATITGRDPHPRAHTYFPLQDPIRDVGLMGTALTHISKLFNGDPACKNPSRIMRVPGTVAWPKKAGRQTELTELKMPQSRRQFFHVTEFTRHQIEIPEPVATTSILSLNNSSLHASELDNRNADNITKMLEGDNWHTNMVAAVARMVAKGDHDTSIQATFQTTTLPGYTAQETADEVQVAIDTARKKGFEPKASQAAALITQEQAQTDWDVGDTSNHIPVTWFEDVQASTDTQDFVEDTLGIGQMSVVYGESNSGKTFFACDLALHTSMGWDWRGLETEQTGVIYCALEGTHGITNRLAAFKDHYKDKMQGEIPPFGIITTGINLLDPEADTRRLIDTVIAAQDRAPQPVGLIVIDTLSRAISGGNENSPDDMGAIVINSDRIRQATGGHVMFIHHSGKDQARGARGHSLLRAATDTEIEVQRSDNGPSVATVRKQREFEGGQEYAFGLKQITLGLNKRGKEVTSCVVTHDAEMPIKQKPGRPLKLNSTAIPLLEIIREAIAKEGVIHHSNAFPQGIKTLSEERCLNVYRAAGKSPKGHENTYYERAIKNLLTTGTIVMHQGFLWEPKQEKVIAYQGDKS